MPEDKVIAETPCGEDIVGIATVDECVFVSTKSTIYLLEKDGDEFELNPIPLKEKEVLGGE